MDFLSLMRSLSSFFDVWNIKEGGVKDIFNFRANDCVGWPLGECVACMHG